MVKRDVCPYCGIDAETGPYAHAKREDCIRALKDKHAQYRFRVSRLVMDKLEETYNHIGGVVGYKLNLTADETEHLCREISAEVSHAAGKWWEHTNGTLRHPATPVDA